MLPTLKDTIVTLEPKQKHTTCIDIPPLEFSFKEYSFQAPDEQMKAEIPQKEDHKEALTRDELTQEDLEINEFTFNGNDCECTSQRSD